MEKKYISSVINTYQKCQGGGRHWPLALLSCDDGNVSFSMSLLIFMSVIRYVFRSIPLGYSSVTPKLSFF